MIISSFVLVYLRQGAEKVAAVGNKLRASRETGFVGRDEQHQPRDLFRRKKIICLPSSSASVRPSFSSTSAITTFASSATKRARSWRPIRERRRCRSRSDYR